MRQEIVTYDVFCQAIQKMLERGEEISVRTVLSHTGGSFAKIAVFLKRWRQEQAHVQTTDHELSPNLKQAILAEIGKAVTTARTLLEKQVAQMGEQLDEAIEALAKQEKTLGDYEQQVNQLNQQLAIANQTQAQQAEKIQSLEKKLEQSIRDQHEADKRAAVAETRCSELEKQLIKQEKQEKETTQQKEKKEQK